MNAIERDFYEERRRKWRRSAFWKGFFVAVLLAIVISFFAFSDSFRGSREHVARYQINGIISDSIERDDLLSDLARDQDAKAVILRINSPGGTTAGSESLFASIRKIAEDRPVVAVMSEVAASGGYVAAIAADHIVARGNTVTGSIGVIMEYPDLTNVLDRLGIEVETVRSSELKAEPSPWRPTNPAARARDEALVAESFIWFRDLVGERRDLSGAELSEVANGGIFTGRLAVANGLVDELGGESEALAWLDSQQPGVGSLPVYDWKIEQDEPLLGRLLGRIGISKTFLSEISRQGDLMLYSIGQ
ncbi:signal peptide peptidase SppA [Amaricoccus tamworthensis]|uniref:signal peptide peptidase SppA n=1 Tax=Amaricoccus tamworthensis TaxID=57002 RepID=UPI003C7C692E